MPGTILNAEEAEVLLAPQAYGLAENRQLNKV